MNTAIFAIERKTRRVGGADDATMPAATFTGTVSVSFFDRFDRCDFHHALVPRINSGEVIFYVLAGAFDEEKKHLL